MPAGLACVLTSMSAPKIPPDARAEVDACWTCLLAHLLRHLSCCLSSLATSLSPSSPAHLHTSALPLVLDHLLVALPPQQQHFHHEIQQQKEREDAPPTLFPSSLLQLDIFGVLLLISDNLRVLLSTVAESCGYEAPEYSACISGTREEVGLLGKQEAYARESKGCLQELLVLFQRKRIQSVQKETNGIEIAGKELSKRFMETVSDLQKYSDHLEISFRNVSAELSSTVALMTSRLTSSQKLTSCSTTAHLRLLMRSFLYGKEEESPLISENADRSSHDGDDCLIRKAEVVIEQLIYPQGPQIVGLGGSRGLGKTCLASRVACDKRISANFPGGVLYLSVGCDPDVTSLQAQLWKQMCGGSICFSTTAKAKFSTPEEGTAALMSRAQEWLPCLLVLDDICDAAHVQPFLCFDGNERGRVLVISHSVESVLANWKGDTFVLVLEHLDEEEASSLFKSIAGYKVSDKDLAMAALTRNCAGTPRLIEAAASIVYYEKARAFTLPSVLSLLKEGGIVNRGARLPFTNMFTSGVVGGGENVPEAVSERKETPEQQDVSMSPEKKDVSVSPLFDWTNVNLIVFFDALAEVHPSLQECFLDLAAFPKGKWVSLSTLVDVWSFGNRMEKEKSLFVLCFLASRSLIEWKVEENPDNEFDEVFSFYWRMADVFYELAQALIQRRLKEVSKLSAVNIKEEKIISGESKEGLDGSACDVIGILDLLQRTVNAFDISTWLHTKQTVSSACCVHEHRNKRLYDVLWNINCSSRRGLFSYSCTSLQENCRLFFPGWYWDQHTARWNEGKSSNKATKLSLISADMTEFPAEVDCPKLNVALLSNITKLKSIPENSFKCMEQLVVLDLKHCDVLSLLPASVCCLQCLEVLDLSSCTQLLSLPQAIGKLKNLRYLRLSGCLSLTCLPISLGSLANLLILDLSLCLRLRSLPKTLGNLSCLQMVNLSGCYSLQCLPATIASLRKLHTLIISGCSNLSYTPPGFQQLMKLLGGRTGSAMAVPLQLWKLDQIEVLHLCSLKNLTYLPQSVGKLQHLRHLNLSSCRSLDYLPDDVGSLFLLEKLDLSHTAIRKLPTTMGQLSSMVMLCLRGCSRLLCIPPSLSALPKLECLEMAECWDFVMLPAEFGNAHSLPKLIELDLSGCSLKTLPYFAEGALGMLRKLQLSSCQNLSFLPDTFCTLTSLERMDLEGCKSLASLQGIGLSELKQLQWINLRNCLSLTNLPVLELLGLQSLKFLDVSGCTKLSPFPEPLLQCAREHRFTLVRWGTLWH